MLDSYIETQPIAYRVITNQLKKDLINHAYIIETNGNGFGLDFAKSFAKSLLCPFKYTSNKQCIDCFQCNQINDNSFIELKIIEPNGMWITKGQIEELQNTFMKKAVVGSKKVYIINHFEKMKSNVMDSMLKFIEEPMEGIVALLICDNVNNIIDTIVSRCQIISLRKDNTKNFNNLVDKIKYTINYNFDDDLLNDDFISKVIKFINYYENNHMKTLLYTKELWFDNFKDSNMSYIALNIILLFYKDTLHYMLKQKIGLFNDYNDDIIKVAKFNSIYNLTEKIDIIRVTICKIKYNANLNLLIDKLIIDLEKR